MNSTMRAFTYSWFHLPTGKSGTGVITAYSRERVLEKINEFNHSNDWKYTLKIENPAGVYTNEDTEFKVSEHQVTK